jgi:hypothetical protein
VEYFPELGWDGRVSVRPGARKLFCLIPNHFSLQTKNPVQLSALAQFALDKILTDTRTIAEQNQSRSGRFMGKEKSSSDRKATAIIATLMTCVALLFLFFFLYQFPPSFNLKPHEALGRELANETVKLLGPGGRIFVITRETKLFENPAMQAQLKSFSQTVKKAGATLTATNLIEVDPLRLVSVPPGEFFEILRQVSENDAIASFLGPPMLSEAQVAKLGGKRPHVAAVCSGAMPAQIDLKKIFEQQLLHVAIISRPVVPSPPPPTDTPQAWFDYLYQVITPANLADLPPLPGARR